MTIEALLVAENKIMTGICFPSCEVENEFPHVTLMLNSWTAKMSNNLLEATCRPGEKFHDAYQELKDEKLKKGTIMQCSAKLVQPKDFAHVYFIKLDQQVTFKGIMKSF